MKRHGDGIQFDNLSREELRDLQQARFVSLLRTILPHKGLTGEPSRTGGSEERGPRGGKAGPHLPGEDAESTLEQGSRTRVDPSRPHDGSPRANHFYVRKFSEAGLDLEALVQEPDLSQLPFTTKAELLQDQADHPPFGTVHTYSIDQYCRYHQTSGTKGLPLRWLDTRVSWSWVLGVWTQLFAMVGVTSRDVLFFPFSFGPFLGFWSAFESAYQLGCLCLSGGGMSSTARLRFLLDNKPTVVLCTPTYAQHLVSVAREEGVDLAGSSVRMLIVAGEPGGSVPAIRERIEQGWGARVIDHTGMTETGPVGIECSPNPGGLHILETAHIAEVLDAAGQPVEPGESGELVLTTLGRAACPLIRYRTGDLVRIDPHPCPCGRCFVRLEGGIRGRADDMIVLRGNNLHPSTLHAILYRFPEVVEYRIEVDETGTLAHLRLDVEAVPQASSSDLARKIHQTIHDELLFRAEVRLVPPNTLPRFEMKARRLVRKTREGG